MNTPPIDVLIIAGEASADLHAASLLKELKRLHPELRAFGVGGPELQAQGMEITVPSSALNVIGIADWFDRFREVIGAYKTIAKLVQSRRPDLAILLDLPDYNLKLAGELKNLNVPVAYYISPQVWAWRKYRIKKIRNTVDKMLVVFPFEKAFYEKEGVPVQFVGHPLLERLEGRKTYRTQEEIVAAPRIAILPGSRRSEIRFHQEAVTGLVQKLKAKYPSAEIRIPIAKTLVADHVKEQLGTGIDYTEGAAHKTLEWADVAVVASGTATLETALVGTPFCLFYKASASSVWIFRTFARYTGFIGMPNILHGKEIIKECFQEEANPEVLFAETCKLIEMADYRENQAQLLSQCREMLGNPGASQRAAWHVHHLLQESRRPKTPNPIPYGTHATETP